MGQEPVDGADSSLQNNVKIVEYKEKPKKVIFAEPFKLSFTLPEKATFDGENLSQKDFEILSLTQDKNNSLITEITVLPLGLQVSTLTALGFVTSNGEKIETEPLEIKINEMPSKIKDLIDIRGPYRPFNVLRLILILLLFGILIATIVYFIRRKKRPASLNLTPYEKQEQPMHEIALSQLDILVQSDLWEKNEYKLYYSEISDILRQFLSARFNFGAQKMTARELFKKLKTIPDFKFDFNALQKLQQSISLVKFAKAIPTIEDRDKVLITAKEMIIENKETDLTRYQKKENNPGGKDEKTK
ncbi:MAG: hypothetical protein J5594_00085 [Elusimicrobiaceae bacterium]|nr:hypothetical protein [Elusimicrobiaceae bacterium]